MFCMPRFGESRCAALTALVLGSVLILSCSSQDGNRSVENPTTAVQPIATVETVSISAILEAGVDRKETLVTLVDAVYVGTVTSTDRTVSLFEDGDVWTLYTVAVEDALLGDVSGEITVVQQGGFDPSRNVNVVIEEDELLQSGESYLFASLTGRDSNPEWEGWHFVVPIYGNLRIEDENHRQQLIQEFTEAIVRAGLD